QRKASPFFFVDVIKPTPVSSSQDELSGGKRGLELLRGRLGVSNQGSSHERQTAHMSDTCGCQNSSNSPPGAIPVSRGPQQASGAPICFLRCRILSGQGFPVAVVTLEELGVGLWKYCSFIILLGEASEERAFV
ncbi:unnamed protein product, partial [Arctogadus glacialis]